MAGRDFLKRRKSFPALRCHLGASRGKRAMRRRKV